VYILSKYVYFLSMGDTFSRSKNMHSREAVDGLGGGGGREIMLGHDRGLEQWGRWRKYSEQSAQVVVSLQAVNLPNSLCRKCMK
jgi:hypothetical protein